MCSLTFFKLKLKQTINKNNQNKNNSLPKKLIKQAIQSMIQTKQSDPSPIKHTDYEESSLLNSRSTTHTNQLKRQQQIRDAGESVCPWVLWMGVLFCVVVGIVVYRYATEEYGYGRKNSLSKIDDTLKPINDNFSGQSIQTNMKASNKQTQKKKTTPQDQNLNIQPLNTLPNPTQQTSTEYQPQNTQQQPFPTPYTIWLFPTSLTTYHTHNIQHYSSPGKSTVQRVNTSNYKQLIKSKHVLKALDLVDILQLSQEKLQGFVQQLVMFALVQENGGVIVGGDLVLTEGMDERRLMKRVEQEDGKGFGMFVYAEIGKGNRQQKLKEFEIDFRNYLIGSKKHFWLLKQLVPKMASALEQEIESTFPSAENLLKRYKNQLSQIIQRKYHEYATQEQTNDRVSFLKYMKIFSFGEQDQLNIASPYLFNLSLPAHFQYLSTYSEEALQELIGPLNPIVHLPLQTYSLFLTQLKSSPDHTIFPDSFLYRHILSFSSTYSNIKPLSPQTNPQKYSPWKLPKILWTFVNKLDEKSTLHDHFIANLIARTKQSEFELIVLTQETIQAVLDGKELHEIFSNLKNDQTEDHNKQNEQTLSKLVKWYILKNYGGVFVNFGYFLLDNLNWVTRIRSNQHVFNNIHKDPEVFMFHNHSAVDKWSVNINSGTKIAHNLSYLTEGFVAAMKNSSFIAKELDTILKRLKEHSNPQNSNPQITQQTDPKKPSKIWSISSLLGGDKTDLIIKEKNEQCFDFKDSLSQFQQKYGSLGYVSELVTDVQKQQLNENLFSLEDDSIFRPFFVSNVLDKKEIQKVKSLKEVSLTAQKIKK